MEPYYYKPSIPLSFGPKTRKLPLDWWVKSRPYSLHKPVKRRFPTRSTLASTAYEYIQIDLVDMQAYSRDNRGNKYIMTAIDVFSRRAWAMPLKNKTGTEVAMVLKDFFKQNQPPIYLVADQGMEFYNTHVRRVLTKFRVKLFSIMSPFKASMVERFNRTLKSRLWRYFTYTNNYQWVDVLQDFVHSYNHTPHSSLPEQMTPIEATQKENWHTVWLYQEERQDKKKSETKFSVGDVVRISRWKGIFEKGFTSNFTEEVFTVLRVDQRQKPTMYVLKDADGREMQGKFYAQEMQHAVKRPAAAPRVTQPSTQRTPPPARIRTLRTAKSQAIDMLYKR